MQICPSDNDENFNSEKDAISLQECIPIQFY